MRKNIMVTVLAGISLMLLACGSSAVNVETAGIPVSQEKGDEDDVSDDQNKKDIC